VGKCLGRTAETQRLVADLVPVAMRAVQHVASPPLTHAGEVGDVMPTQW
jgi:hypothetical protein